MSRSSRPNWVAEQRGPSEWSVHDANGSGRAYRVHTGFGGNVTSVMNITAGRKMATLNPRGTVARELTRAINVARGR